MNQKDRILQTLEENKGKWVSSFTWLGQSPRIARAAARVHEINKKFEKEKYPFRIEGQKVGKNNYYYRLVENNE